MQAVEYYAEVLPDGHIALPQNTINDLWLSKGNKIKVILLNEWASELKEENEDSKFCTYNVTINNIGEGQRMLANPIIVTIEQRSEDDFVACFYDVDIYGYGESIPDALDDLKFHIVSQFEFLLQEEKRVELGVFPAKQLAILRNLIIKRKKNHANY